MSQLFPVLGQKVRSIVFYSERVTSRKSKSKPESFSSEIQADLERLHQRARSGLGYKRKEMNVELEDERGGRLVTPDFEYVVHASCDDDQVRWTREASFKEWEKMLGDERLFGAFSDDLDTVVVRFDQALDIPQVVDRIEEQGTPGLRLDYDMQCRWCSLSIEGIPAVVRFEGSEMRVSRQPGTVVSLADMLSLVQPHRLGLG